MRSSDERIEVLSVLDPTYPTRLKMIADPPPLLYITGTLTEQDELAVAIVGARRATAAGRAMTEELSHDLAGSGYDGGEWTCARELMRRPIEARSPRRGAPLRCWAAGSIGPIRRNMSGYADRSRSGGRSCLRCRWARHPTAIIFLDGIASSAGCPSGVVVTEAAIDSGSLITARLAAEQGREVFAVPGFVKEDTSRGTNALLKEGAALIERAQDVIDAILPQLEPALRLRLQPASREERVAAISWAKRNSWCMMPCRMTPSRWTT